MHDKLVEKLKHTNLIEKHEHKKHQVQLKSVNCQHKEQKRSHRKLKINIKKTHALLAF